MDNTVAMVEGPDLGKSDDGVVVSKTEVQKRKSKEEKQPTKVVIRKLPGTMTEESFLEHVSPLFEHDYFCFVQAENPSFGEHNYSRAYLNFTKVEDVFTFTSKFDDYVFLDDSGQEYPAIVEFAPFQRIPKNRGHRRNDSSCGTIEEDPEYQKFLQELESEEQDNKPSQVADHYFDLANDENEEKVTSTPLIEYLTSKKNDWMRHKEEKREERRRRDVERKKLKEENKRVKRENRELAKRAAVEKQKEEKRKATENKAAEEVKMISSERVKGKSYQEERQRDLARRKIGEKGAKGDGKDNNENHSETDKTENDVAAAETKDRRKSDESREDGKRRRSYEEKRSSRDDDRKSSGSSFQRGEKDDRKSYSQGSKKRDYSGNYEYESQYKSKSSGGHHYDDFKSRNNYTSSYQKNSYTNKYGSVKSKEYDEKAAKRYETKSKRADSDGKDAKKSHQWEKAEKSTKSSDEVRKESSTKSENNAKDDKSSSAENSERTTKSEAKTRVAMSDDKKDDRAERRIKNKDRPAMEIYRPGMGKFSRQRLERNKSVENRDED